MKNLTSCKKATLLALLLAQNIICAHSFAGNKAPATPVNAGDTYMSGSFADARSSSVLSEAISISDTGSTMYVFASSATTSKICATTNEVIKAQLRSANSDAFLWVNFNSSGNCTSATIYNDSSRKPKAL